LKLIPSALIILLKWETSEGGKMISESLSDSKTARDKIRSSGLSSAVKSTVLLFSILFPMTFLTSIFHEGGHAFVNLIYRVPNTIIYVHPFSFAGYARPLSNLAGNAWFHAAGPMASILLPLVIFIPLWKRRSVANLFLIMLFPWNVFFQALPVLGIFMKNGDYYNLVQVTGLPSSLFIVGGIVIMLIGIFLINSCLPILDLKPENFHTLWVVPIAILLWTSLGYVVAHWMVPGSTIDVKYHLAPEILQTENLQFSTMAMAGLVFALVYVTLYRAIYRKLLPAWRTATKELSWRDLLWPGMWGAVSVVVGLIVIR
jgi:hypothetical protein